MNKLELDAKDVEKLEDLLSKIDKDAEKEVNSILHEMGFNAVNDDVVDKLPVSNRNKPHAKNSKPFRKKEFNLGFDFISKGGAANKPNSFGYLVFPDQGRGPRNPAEQNFTGRGIEKAKPKIMDELLAAITSKIQEGL